MSFHSCYYVFGDVIQEIAACIVCELTTKSAHGNSSDKSYIGQENVDK